MINRTPFNALVDDTGSNNGTIWNKTQIQTTLLDPIDYAFATPKFGRWNPVLSGGGVLSEQQSRYVKIGPMVLVWVFVDVVTIGSANPGFVDGLPYASLDPFGLAIADFGNLAIACPTLRAFASGTTVRFTATAADGKNMVDAVPILGDGTFVLASGVYQTAWFPDAPD